jgi:hypothetical protein
MRRAGTGSRQLSTTKQTDIGFGEEPALNHRSPKGKAEEAYPLQFSSRDVKFVFSGRNAGQKEKALRPKPEGSLASLSEGRFARFGSCVGVRRRSWGFRLSAAEPAHGIRTHAPEDRELRGLGLLGLAILALVF